MKLGLKVRNRAGIITTFHHFSDSFEQFCQELLDPVTPCFMWGLGYSVQKVSNVAQSAISLLPRVIPALGLIYLRVWTVLRGNNGINQELMTKKRPINQEGNAEYAQFSLFRPFLIFPHYSPFLTVLTV